MSVLIVDIRPTRLEKIRVAASSVAEEVVAVAHLGECTVCPDVILLHVGLEQESEQPNEVTDILNRYQSRAWILCYRGGTAVQAATQCTSPNVAVFPAPVDGIEPGVEFLRTVEQVLTKRRERETLPVEWFRDAVTGFDAVLEAKLDVLSAILSRRDVSKASKKALRSYKNAFDDKGNLLADVGILRRILFHEEPRELPAVGDHGGER